MRRLHKSIQYHVSHKLCTLCSDGDKWTVLRSNSDTSEANHGISCTPTIPNPTVCLHVSSPSASMVHACDTTNSADERSHTAQSLQPPAAYQFLPHRGIGLPILGALPLAADI